MSDDTNGQSVDGTVVASTEATQTTEPGTEGQVDATQTTQTGTDEEESFFDPSSIKGTPLESAYKQMQRAWTQKTTEQKRLLEASQEKLSAYDSFMADPVSSIKALAQQYGLELGSKKDGQWEPESWDEVIGKVREETREKIFNDLDPVIKEVQQIKRNSIEKSLDEYCQTSGLPDWRLHEDKMKKVLSDHPTLVKDPILLYEMALPRNVRESKAMQAAMKKLEEKTRGSQVSPGSNTNKIGARTPEKGMSFEQAVEYARARLAEQGLHAPRQ